MKTIHESELVTGDIIKLREGMELNADMMIIESYEITIDESPLTGEADPIAKTPFKFCIAKRDEVISQGRTGHIKQSTVYSPILMSGTKV